MDLPLVEDDKSSSIQESNELDIVKYHLSISKYCLFKVTINDFTQKDIYVFDIGKSKSITGLVLDKLNESKSSKLVWQVHEVRFKSLQFLEYSNPPIDMSSSFIKYGWDRKIHFGWRKGEDAEMFYPVYRIGKLPLQIDLQETLSKLLEDSGNKQQDWDKDKKIMQIIDPDLNPNYFIEKPSRPAPKVSFFKGLIKKMSLQTQNPIINLDKNSTKYMWFPVDILLKPDNSFDVLGEIHNLNKKGNENLYEYIFTVFKEMIPGFRKLKVLNNKQLQKIQVVIKAQKIIIREGETFEENWHLEGKKEEVIAAGVYFCKVQHDIHNQFMAFKPKKYPANIHKESVDLLPEMTVPVNEHSAIIFGNSIPHRLYSLEKTIPIESEILTISFYIIDPKLRLETNQMRSDVFNILKLRTKLPKVVIDEILSYVYSSLNLKNAKERREQARTLTETKKNYWIDFEDDNTGFYHKYCDKSCKLRL